MSDYAASRTGWTASTAFVRFLAALDQAGSRVEGTGRQRQAQCPCPGHQDRRPSLGIADSTSRVLITCRAGCDSEDVLAALGLTYADLFDGDGEPRERPDAWTPWRDRCRCAPVAYWQYTDEFGELTYEHVRGGHKEFAFRRPDAASRSGWRWSLGDCRRVLYRLPALVNAPDNAVIFVAEGESDADALVAAGEIATTTDAGALTGSGRKAWRPEWSEALRGRDVLVTADRDAPGRVHARHVAETLDGTARYVWIVEAAEGKDVRDHLTAGLAVTDLVWWS